MSGFILPLVLTLQAMTPLAGPPSPVAAMHRFDLNVIYWQGSFGTYMSPAVGSKVQLDLAAVGTNDLLSSSLTDKDDRKLNWLLSYLNITSDKTTGDANRGWTRRVVLKGPAAGDPKSSARTILELRILYQVEHYKEHDGRRVKQTSNMTHYILTLHTLESDDTVREFARASHSLSRD